jgi:hypothetical protein
MLVGMVYFYDTQESDDQLIILQRDSEATLVSKMFKEDEE